MNYRDLLDSAAKAAVVLAALVYVVSYASTSVIDLEKLDSVLTPLSKLSVVAAALGYLLQRRVMHLQHERARREKATAAIHEYAKSLTPRSAAATRLVSKLSTLQIDKLDGGQAFAIAVDLEPLLVAALPDHIEAVKQDNGEVTLTRNQSYLLRWEVIAKLNALEVVSQCWLTDVAHRETIESELRYLLGPKEGDNVMTLCGKLADPRDFPALAALMNELERLRRRGETPIKIDFTPVRRRIS